VLRAKKGVGTSLIPRSASSMHKSRGFFEPMTNANSLPLLQKIFFARCFSFFSQGKHDSQPPRLMSRIN